MTDECVMLIEAKDEYLEWAKDGGVSYKSKFETIHLKRLNIFDLNSDRRSFVRHYMYFPSNVDLLAFKIKFGL
jgi:hypothetical protein